MKTIISCTVRLLANHQNTPGSTRILISKCIDIPQSSPSVVSGWIGFPSLAFSYKLFLLPDEGMNTQCRYVM